ncbi:unnamed protein product [Lactuca virosa]|uniref:Uncharacterized protein n=1 Tax=Lactuca virosa TaxID=75947 RepID=A0AAU9NSD2_9ASTR|nr:unnamed protein product [Lactuca virosa]
MYVTPENYKYIGDNDVGVYVNDVGVNDSFDKKKAVAVVNKVGNESRKQEVPFLHDGELKGYGEFADCDKLDISGLDSDSNGEELDDESKLIYSDTMFHGMSPLPSCPVNADVNIPCQRVYISEEIKVLDIFDDKELLKLAIGRQCMEQGQGESNQLLLSKSQKLLTNTHVVRQIWSLIIDNQRKRYLATLSLKYWPETIIEFIGAMKLLGTSILNFQSISHTNRHGVQNSMRC